ncbi:hypothetical protein MNEG_2328 [Monoraphidium neglectum]|uniref:Uncharacterized protein n=1 Tax=Monoraphidium neglectum TaxID=145388 RepID=A0A0D2K5G9_9CHLO|nr:hypothetical protein MNEG_2328 [Monoraphidium neglectum]KIZ05628.1 hypothetical protein MNEG_2328 [Monoraphidium neglectum]|eukprot:XP_013904647.1 hypothetical protein MNEG_2328 [Monoraphidium neglectum]
MADVPAEPPKATGADLAASRSGAGTLHWPRADAEANSGPDPNQPAGAAAGAATDAMAKGARAPAGRGADGAAQPRARAAGAQAVGGNAEGLLASRLVTECLSQPSRAGSASPSAACHPSPSRSTDARQLKLLSRPAEGVSVAYWRRPGGQATDGELSDGEREPGARSPSPPARSASFSCAPRPPLAGAAPPGPRPAAFGADAESAAGRRGKLVRLRSFRLEDCEADDEGDGPERAAR